MLADRIRIMKSIRELTEQLEQALLYPRQEFGRCTRFLFFQIELWRFCFRRLRENNVMAMSSALSFRTIFAMIPGHSELRISGQRCADLARSYTHRI